MNNIYNINTNIILIDYYIYLFIFSYNSYLFTIYFTSFNRFL